MSKDLIDLIDGDVSNVNGVNPVNKVHNRGASLQRLNAFGLQPCCLFTFRFSYRGSRDQSRLRNDRP
jgi:hypothetical protein